MTIPVFKQYFTANELLARWQAQEQSMTLNDLWRTLISREVAAYLPESCLYVCDTPFELYKEIESSYALSKENLKDRTVFATYLNLMKKTLEHEITSCDFPVKVSLKEGLKSSTEVENDPFSLVFDTTQTGLYIQAINDMFDLLQITGHIDQLRSMAKYFDIECFDAVKVFLECDSSEMYSSYCDAIVYDKEAEISSDIHKTDFCEFLLSGVPANVYAMKTAHSEKVQDALNRIAFQDPPLSPEQRACLIEDLQCLRRSDVVGGGGVHVTADTILFSRHDIQLIEAGETTSPDEETLKQLPPKFQEIYAALETLPYMEALINTWGSLWKGRAQGDGKRLPTDDEIKKELLHNLEKINSERGAKEQVSTAEWVLKAMPSMIKPNWKPKGRPTKNTQ